MAYDEEGAKYRRAQAGAYLRSVRDAKRHIQALGTEVDELRELASGLCGVDYTRDMVSTSPTDDAMANAAARIIELCEQRTAIVREYVAMLDECSAALDRMGGTHADVLRYRYVCGYQWERIATLMHFSEQWLYELHNSALEVFYDLMPHAFRDPVHSAF